MFYLPWRAIALALAALALSVFAVSCDKTPAGAANPPSNVPPDPQHYEPTPVVQWNQELLEAIRHSPPRPTVIARSLYLVHLAMYEAWVAYDTWAVGVIFGDALRRQQEQRTDANRAIAVSHAAFRALQALFADYEAQTGAFAARLAALGLEPSDDTTLYSPEGVGHAAALGVLAAYGDDGSNHQGGYRQVVSPTYPVLYAPTNRADPASPYVPGKPDFVLGRWQPLRVPTGALTDSGGNPVVDDYDASSYIDQTFLTPHWGAVRPFALQRGDEFRPSAPAQPGSHATYVDATGTVTTEDQAFRDQVAEVLAISGSLTDEQKAIAEYWLDGPTSETPPGHWNLFAQWVSFRDRHTLADDVKLFFALNAAMHDAAISCWDAKRTYDVVRPVSAIRHLYAGQHVAAWGGRGRGTQVIDGADWQPYQPPTFVTPAFPEYTSGHSTFSAAAAEVLTRFTGSHTFYDPKVVLPYDHNGDGERDILGEHIVPAGGLRLDNGPAAPIVLRWATYQDAAREAGISRLYGGIHFQDGNLRGREAGEQIGARAFDLAASYWTGTR